MKPTNKFDPRLEHDIHRGYFAQTNDAIVCDGPSFIIYRIEHIIIMSCPRIRTNENDVLLGRGGNNYAHSGNEQLRRVALGRVGEYMLARKKQKAVISR
jgi:hypothetical protein